MTKDERLTAAKALAHPGAIKLSAPGYENNASVDEYLRECETILRDHFASYVKFRSRQ